MHRRSLYALALLALLAPFLAIGAARSAGAANPSVVEQVIDLNAKPTVPFPPRAVMALGDALLLMRRSRDSADQQELLAVRGGAATLIATIDAQGFLEGRTIARSGVGYFIARRQGGEELWRSDGTAAGTFRLLNLPDANNPSMAPSHSGIALVITRANTTSDYYFSDGTVAGTRLVRSFPGYLIPSTALATHTLFVVLSSPSNLMDLWSSDGTAAGTTQIDSGLSQFPSESLASFALYGAVIGGKGVVRRTDGTAAGTTTVTTQSSGDGVAYPTWLGVTSDRIFFSTNTLSDTILWRADAAGVAASIATYDAQDTGRIAIRRAIGGELFYSLLTKTGEASYWRVGGSGSPTMMPPPPWQPVGIDSLSLSFLEIGGRAFLSYQSGQSTASPSDDQTELIAIGDSSTTIAATIPGRQVGSYRIGTAQLFLVQAATVPYEIWRSDGTAAGTSLVTQLPIDFRNADVTAGNTLIYLTSVDPNVNAVMRSDGTAAGTYQIAVPPYAPLRTLDAASYEIHTIGGRLTFDANDGTTWRWWQLTSAGQIAPVISPGTFQYETTFSGVALGRRDGAGLWRTDGTLAGTVFLSAITPSSRAQSADTLFFADERTIARSDGTPAGTRQLCSIPAATTTVRYRAIDLAIGDGALFALLAREEIRQLGGQTGWTFVWNELWRCPPDGGALTNVPTSHWIDAIATVGGHIVFLNDTMISSLAGEIGKLPAGQTFDRTSYHDVNRLGSKVDVLTLQQDGGRLWVFSRGSSATHLLTSDGTPGSLRQIATINDNGRIVMPREQVIAGGRLFFVAADADRGSALWISDGTAAGTRALAAVGPTNLYYLPDRGLLYFAGQDSNGSEPWVSDGTPAGTRMLADVNPGAASSYPGDFAQLGQDVYFAATTPAYGRELWREHVALANQLFLPTVGR